MEFESWRPSISANARVCLHRKTRIKVPVNKIKMWLYKALLLLMMMMMMAVEMAGKKEICGVSGGKETFTPAVLLPAGNVARLIWHNFRPTTFIINFRPTFFINIRLITFIVSF